MDKKETRKLIRELKKEYSLEQKKEMSRPIWEQLQTSEQFRNAKTVLAYWSMDDEVYTHEFIPAWSSEKTFLLPCVKGDELEIRYFDGAEHLVPGEGFAIPEPIGELFENIGEIDLIIVPGVAFDECCNRLGRGKGYYDKILTTTSTYKIGVCFDFQFLPQIPVDAHDVPMSCVITSHKKSYR